MEVEVKKLETLAELTSFIEETCQDQSEVLFRGQAHDRPLLPAISRAKLTYGDLLSAEREMLAEFQRYSVPYLRSLPPTDWDWMALAQHHGLPTRLLDWSINPLTALWFVVHRPREGQDHGVLWMFQPEEEDFATEEDQRSLEFSRYSVFWPRHVSERMPAQGSLFTVHKTLKTTPYFEPFERSAELAEKLTKIIIPAGRFAHLRFYLDKFGVTHASVFPGLDGLGAYIGGRRFFLSDERPD
jgi:hypothetical protein